MSIRYSEDFKKEVVKAYMAGDKSIHQLLNEKDAKREYHKRLEHIFELIKYVYYNNNRVIGYRVMRIFIKRYGYELSNTTMHKYMNKELNLCAVIMHSKPGYKAGKKKKSLTIS